jgi:hypothetical protein
MRPHSPGRRQLAAGLAAAAAAWLVPARAGDSALPVPASLQRAALQAQRAGEPLVLLVSLPGCPYCELVRRNYLLPMRAQGLHAWQLDVTDRRTAILGFGGEATHGAALATQWQARFTPTVLFFNAAGVEIAPRLVGIAVPDLYGAYLDDALAAARKRLSESR